MLAIAAEGKFLRNWGSERSMFMMMKKRGRLENRKEDGNDKIRSMCSFNNEWKEMGTWKIKKKAQKSSFEDESFVFILSLYS